MQLSDEQANRIYAAFGLNAVAVKQAALRASEASPTLDSRDSHVLAMLLGWLKAHEDKELADCAYIAFVRLQDVLYEAEEAADEEGDDDG
jgi:hypothetical protein